MVQELEDMETIYNIIVRHEMDAQRRMLEWVAKVTDEENNKKLHSIREAKLASLGGLGDEEMIKRKA